MSVSDCCMHILYVYVVHIALYCTLGLYACTSVFLIIHVIDHAVLFVLNTLHFGNKDGTVHSSLAAFDSAVEESGLNI